MINVNIRKVIWKIHSDSNAKELEFDRESESQMEIQNTEIPEVRFQQIQQSG